MGIRRKVATLVGVVGLVATSVACLPPGGGHGGGDGQGGPGGQAARGPVAPLASEGRWLVDATGRVVTLHGVNEVTKTAPYYPAADGFGADDAAFLADQGFTAVRLGVEMLGLMPEVGRVEEGYVENLAQSVEHLGDEGIFVLLDFHQDCWGSKYDHNGFPDWMTVDDGLPVGDTTFPLCYINSPAIQRAFESFWANRPAPDGVGLQDHFVRGLTAVAQRFAGDDHVLGYELMNEPWPGADWTSCVYGGAEACAAQEQQLLAPFYRKATEAVRAVTTTQPVVVEPFVLFNFGQVGTSLPGGDSGNLLSVHSYALDLAGEEQVVANAVAAAERDGAPAVMTEFGATNDVATLERLTAQMDTGLLSWMFWAYADLVPLRDEPAGLDQVADLDVLRALVRPHPVAVAGTPTAAAFDPATRTYDLSYDAAAPGGQRLGRNLPTVVSVPELQYDDGYRVEVAGARVTSRPCADRLTLVRQQDAAAVSVRITPGGPCA
jgi:endoglycosylceramidase